MKISEIFGIVEANKSILERTETEPVTLESIEKIEQLLTNTLNQTDKSKKSNKRKINEKKSEEPVAKRRYQSRNKKCQNQTQVSPSTSNDTHKSRRDIKQNKKEINPITSGVNKKIDFKDDSSLLVNIDSIDGI